MTRKNKLINCFYKAIDREKKYIGVKIKLPNLNDTETIINPQNNFEEKLKYYKDNYDDDLKLKHNPEVEILDFYHSDSYQEIEQQFSV